MSILCVRVWSSLIPTSIFVSKAARLIYIFYCFQLIYYLNLSHFTCVIYCVNVAGKPAGDDAKIAELLLKPGTKIMMMGTREEEINNVKEPPQGSDSAVVNDFDIEEDEIAIENRCFYVLVSDVMLSHEYLQLVP